MGLTTKTKWDADGCRLHIEDAHHRFVEGDDALVAEIDILTIIGTVGIT